jgi:GT2 family glycosyltransferase
MNYNISFTIIIVTYNSENTVSKCIKSVIDQVTLDDEIVVVDNASTDSTVGILTPFSEDLKLFISDFNFGFSSACNFAVEKSTSPYILFLNPDAIINPGLLCRARESFSKGDYELVGFMCRDEIGEIDRNYRRYPGFLASFMDYYSRNSISRNRDNFNLDTHYLDGSCMFIERSIFLKAGMFVNYFLYGEDVILCNKIQKIGVKSIYHQDIFYTHLRGASSVTESGDRSWNMLPNIVYSELYFLKGRSFSYRFFYLVVKISESASVGFLLFAFYRDNKSKINFFKNRCDLLLKYSFEYLFQGNQFYKPEFHQENYKIENRIFLIE